MQPYHASSVSQQAAALSHTPHSFPVPLLLLHTSRGGLRRFHVSPTPAAHRSINGSTSVVFAFHFVVEIRRDPLDEQGVTVAWVSAEAVALLLLCMHTWRAPHQSVLLFHYSRKSCRGGCVCVCGIACARCDDDRPLLNVAAHAKPNPTVEQVCFPTLLPKLRIRREEGGRWTTENPRPSPALLSLQTKTKQSRPFFS